MGLFEPFFYIIGLIVDIYFNVVVVQVVLFWLVHFKILQVNNVYTQKTMDFLDAVTKPVYKKIGERIPPFNGLDFSPFVLLLALLFISRFMDRLSAMVL
ncbi:MAG: YggT family protein [Alphaproteobacteria bacterium]|nr:YggT family protein [Alphaproteobacteria bacterium]